MSNVQVCIATDDQESVIDLTLCTPSFYKGTNLEDLIFKQEERVTDVILDFTKVVNSFSREWQFLLERDALNIMQKNPNINFVCVIESIKNLKDSQFVDYISK